MAREHAEHISTLLSAQIDLYRVINDLPGTAEFLLEASSAPYSRAECQRLDALWPKLTPSDPPLKQMLNNELALRWQAIQRQQPRTAKALITDRLGRLAAAANKTTDYYQGDDPWWERCWANGLGRTVVAGPLFDESAISSSGTPGAIVVNVCLPIRDSRPGRQNDMVGIIKLALEVGWLIDELRGITPSPSNALATEVLLVDGQGQLITSPPAQIEKLPAPLLDALRSKPDGYLISPMLSERELVGFSRVTFRGPQLDAPQDWTVMVMGPRSSALASTRFILWAISLVGATVIAFCFVGGWWLARHHLIRPLFTLQHGAKELEQGHLDFRLQTCLQMGTVFHNDEIGQLARDFDLMARQLELNVAALDKANRLKQQFIDLASHELRTPITYIAGVTELAERQSSPEAALLARIKSRAQRLCRIVENMFKLMQSGQFEPTLRLEQVDLARLAAAVVQDLDPFLIARQQSIELKIPQALPTITADAEKLRDVLNNLLTNAIRFSTDRSRLGLQVINDEATVQIVVTDTGPGITPEDMPQVFEPFYRGQRELARHSSGEFEYMTRGIGLGLSVVKRFVELHGGTVTAESTAHGLDSRPFCPSSPTPRRLPPSPSRFRRLRLVRFPLVPPADLATLTLRLIV